MICPCLCEPNNVRETGQGSARAYLTYSWRSPPPASIGQYEHFSLSLLRLMTVLETFHNIP
jgi:hypothetical protein